MQCDEKYICAICGNAIDDKPTIDHFIPRAIYKWLVPVSSKTDKEKLLGGIMSKKNIILVHKSCNMDKGCTFIPIDQLIVDERKAQKLYNNCIKMKPYVLKFVKMYDDILKRQEGQCYCCGDKLKGNGVIRRIDTSKRRIIDNGCIVCPQCNLNQADFVRKTKEILQKSV